MAKVNFVNIGKTVEGKDGDSILDIALEHDVPLAHACGGVCACTTCHVIVKSGAENLDEMDEPEEERLDRATGVTLHSRLGCQAKVKRGEVSVEILNIGDGH